MNKDKKEFLEDYLQELIIEASYVKHLAKILEELIQNGNCNISPTSIATLSVILTRTACTLTDKINDLGLKLEQ